VVDTFLAPEPARRLHRLATELTSNPVSYVVNTHYHNDHIRGNQVFSDAIIISTAQTRRLIEEREPGQIEADMASAPDQLKRLLNQKVTETDPKARLDMDMWIGYYQAMVESEEELQTVLPSLTFSNQLVLHGRDRTVELKEFVSGHTGSDLVVWLPDDGVLFSGDLVFNRMHPYLADGSPEFLKETLRSLTHLGPASVIVVPGHGEVGGKGTIERMIDYLTVLDDRAKHVVSEGTSDTSVPAQFADWEFDQFYRSNLSFVLGRIRKGSY